MRNGVLAGLVLMSVALGACGASAPTGNAGPDAGSNPDNGADAGISSLDIAVPARVVAAGEETWECLYTTLDSGRAAGIKQWQSTMSAGIVELVVFFSDTASEQDGTVKPCGFPTDIPRWVYWANAESDALAMPAGVGMSMAQPQPAIVRVHYANASVAEVTATANITADLHAAGQSWVEAASFLSMNTQIDLQPGLNDSTSGSCAVPSGATFFALTTRTRTFGTKTEVRDGQAVVFQSTDWANPGDAPWGSPPHYAFSGNLGYQCEYYNSSTQTVRYGEGMNDETCDVIAYFFPATKQVTCLNSFILP